MVQKAFTLIELLIILVIIGVLATIAIPQLNNMVEKSRNPEAIANLKMILDAEWNYRTETGEWLAGHNVGNGYAWDHFYLDPNDPDVIAFFNALGIKNPNSLSGRKWNCYFAWVDLHHEVHPPNSIAFFALSRSDPSHGVAMTRAPYGSTSLQETFQYGEVTGGGWYWVKE